MCCVRAANRTSRLCSLFPYKTKVSPNTNDEHLPEIPLANYSVTSVPRITSDKETPMIHVRQIKPDEKILDDPTDQDGDPDYQCYTDQLGQSCGIQGTQ